MDGMHAAIVGSLAADGSYLPGSSGANPPRGAGASKARGQGRERR